VKVEKLHAEGLDAAARLRNFENAKMRQVTKLRTNTHAIVPWWNTSDKTNDYKMLVLSEVWGRDWDRNHELSSTQWVIYCKIYGLKRITMLNGLFTLLPEIDKLHCDYGELLAMTVTDEDVAVLEAEAKQHNKKMHADNGNTGLSRTMNDVIARPEAMALADSGKFTRSSRQLLGSTVDIRMAFLSSSANPLQNDVWRSSMVRGDVVSGVTNVTTNNLSQNLPSTTWIPRSLRTGAGAVLGPTTQRLPTYVIGVSQFMTGELTETMLGKAITELYTTGNVVLGRADSTSASGFQMMDMAQLAIRKSIYGLVLDQCLLKLELLHSYSSWFSAPTNMLPFNQFSAIDQFTIPSGTAPVKVINNTPANLYGESCGGATSEFPFGGVGTATIAFHLTTETVPLNQRPNALFIPPGLITQDETTMPGVALSLFAFMWASHPATMNSCNVSTTDNAGGHAAVQFFTHMSSLIHVPGLATIDIILPRRTTSVNPTQQARANEMALVTPQTGSTVTTTFPAPNTPINVNYIGAGYISVDLAEYLYSWSRDWDTTTISSYIARLSYMTGTAQSLERVHDIVTNTVQVFPSMTAAVPTAPVLFTPDSAQQFRVFSTNCVSLVPTIVDWPQLPTRGLMLVNATDPIAWNKVAVGLSTGFEKAGDSYQLAEYLGNIKAAWWEQCVSTVFACFWTSFLSVWGWSADTWNSVYTNNGIMSAFRTQARSFIANVPSALKVQEPVYMGVFLQNLWEAQTGCRLGTNSWSTNTVTVFDNYAPRNGDSSTVADNAATYSHCTPCVMPDVLCQVFLSKIPQFQTSFPVPSGPDSTRGFYAGLKALGLSDNINAGGLVDPDHVQFMLDADCTADFTDPVRWNERLIYVGGVAAPTYMDATPVATGLPAGIFAITRSYTPAPGFPALAGGLFAANTFCYATTDLNGRYTYAITTVANIAIYRRAMYNQARLNYSAWLINDVLPFDTTLRSGNEAIKSRFTKYINQGKVGSASTSLARGGEDTVTSY
jgi:hypothetical protein